MNLTGVLPERSSHSFVKYLRCKEIKTKKTKLYSETYIRIDWERVNRPEVYIESKCNKQGLSE